MDKSDKIIIKDGKKVACDICHETLLIFNEFESLYCNVSLVYLDNKNRVSMAKCRSCKTLKKIIS